MNKNLCITRLIVLCAAAFLLRCGVSPLAGGNSSQTGNAGIAVSARNQSIYGKTASGAHVAIFEQNYKPYVTPSGICDSTMADDSGRFSFSAIQAGAYNLVAIDVRHDNLSAFISGIPVYPDSMFNRTIDSLKMQGFISGAAVDTFGAIYPLSYIFIEGTPFYTITKNNGDFLLGPLPPGRYATGMFAKFKVFSAITGTINLTPMASAITKASEVVVSSDSVSVWRW